MSTSRSCTIIEETTAIPLFAPGHDLTLVAFEVSDGDASREVLALRTANLDVEGGRVPLVRVHSACVTSEVFGSTLCDCALQLQDAIRVVSQSRNGLILYLPWQEGRGNGAIHKVKVIERRLRPPTAAAQRLEQLNMDVDKREYSAATAVVRHLGITTLRLVTNNPAKIAAFRREGLSVERVASMIPFTDPQLIEYRKYCISELGHLE